MQGGEVEIWVEWGVRSREGLGDLLLGHGNFPMMDSLFDGFNLMLHVLSDSHLHFLLLLHAFLDVTVDLLRLEADHQILSEDVFVVCSSRLLLYAL